MSEVSKQRPWVRLPWLTAWLFRRLRRVRHTAPDLVIGGAEDPYMLRWYVIPRNRLLNIYHHYICRDDDDRALHDHPWMSVSIILDGEMREVLSTDGRSRLLRAGPRIREWGFHCPNGWRHWKDFTGFHQTGDSTRIGPGCD